MALDPNLVLNLKPYQQPDNLAMLAQVMQIRRMQEQGRLADLQRQQNAQLFPLQLQEHQANLAAASLKQREAEKLAAFRSPANLARFMQPGRPAAPLAEGLSGPTMEAEPPKMNLQALLDAQMQAGIGDPVALAKERLAEAQPKFAPSRSPGYFQNGKWTPTPENAALTKPMIEHNFSVGENMVQPHVSLDNGLTWKPLPGSAPSAKFARQVGPTVTMPTPVTAVTLQDPNDPNGTIIIDGRTGRLFGKGPKLTDAGKLENKRAFNMAGIGKAIQEAEDLLNKNPTQSGAGSLVDKASAFVGYAPDSAVVASQLEAVGGALVSKVPRMEGPQSDKDLKMYQEMAGKVGDRTQPVAARKAALEKVKDLWAKYERLNPDAFADRRASGGFPTQSEIDAELARRKK